MKDNFFDWIFKNFGKVWAAGVVIYLLFVAVIVWAIIKVVLHFT